MKIKLPFSPSAVPLLLSGCYYTERPYGYRLVRRSNRLTPTSITPMRRCITSRVAIFITGPTAYLAFGRAGAAQHRVTFAREGGSGFAGALPAP